MMQVIPDIETQLKFYTDKVKTLQDDIAKLTFELNTYKKRLNQYRLLNDIHSNKITCIETATGRTIPTNFS